jgi:hypothetical protein
VIYNINPLTYKVSAVRVAGGELTSIPLSNITCSPPLAATSMLMHEYPSAGKAKLV